ncbi:MAG: hypothetical protein Ct9H90mP16_16410 [Candidatus Poseidoniales archaeon]|nr:MAG: hypothetical protein Ct9H90mP16_16410 [Candidatus Poseidoniales archaeon]
MRYWHLVAVNLGPDVSQWDLGEMNVADFDSIATIYNGVVKG